MSVKGKSTKRGLIAAAAVFLVVILFILAGFIAFEATIKSGNGESIALESVSWNDEGFLDYSRKVGADKAYDALKQKYPGNDASVHDLAHIIGIVAFEKDGNSGISLCDNAFNYGCYHGFTEAMIAKNGISSVSEIEQNCVDLGSIIAPSCLHGIGHGVLAFDGYKLEKGLLDCDVLQEVNRMYCWDGVFMEYNNPSMVKGNTLVSISSSDPQEPCVSIDEKYRTQCFRNKVYVWVGQSNGQSEKVAALCMALDDKYHEMCVENMGISFGMSFGENLSKISESCGALKDGALRDRCFYGAMDELMFEGKDPQIASEVCNLVTADKKDECSGRYNNLLNIYKQRFSKS